MSISRLTEDHIKASIKRVYISISPNIADHSFPREYCDHLNLRTYKAKTLISGDVFCMKSGCILIVLSRLKGTLLMLVRCSYNTGSNRAWIGRDWQLLMKLGYASTHLL